jgi:cytochrome c biogenesis factor
LPWCTPPPHVPCGSHIFLSALPSAQRAHTSSYTPNRSLFINTAASFMFMGMVLYLTAVVYSKITRDNIIKHSVTERGDAPARADVRE